jgi:hypothetical protein
LFTGGSSIPVTLFFLHLPLFFLPLNSSPTHSARLQAAAWRVGERAQARRRRRQERALARLGPGAGRAEAQRAGRRWDARLAAASGGSWRRAGWRWLGWALRVRESQRSRRGRAEREASPRPGGPAQEGERQSADARAEAQRAVALAARLGAARRDAAAAAWRCSLGASGSAGCRRRSARPELLCSSEFFPPRRCLPCGHSPCFLITKRSSRCTARPSRPSA